MLNLSMRKIRVVLTSASEKNFTKASIKENISQPAVTNIIKEVEEYIGAKIFIRTGSVRKAELSEEGEQIIRVFSKILYEYEGALNSIKSPKGDIEWKSKIELQEELIHFIDYHSISKFNRNHDDSYMHLNSNNKVKILENIKNRKIGIGIVENPEIYKGLDVVEVENIDVKFSYVGKSIPNKNSRGGCFRLEDVDQDALILSKIPSETEIQLKKEFAKRELNYSSFRKVASVNMMRKLILHSDYSCIMPTTLASDMGERDDLYIHQLCDVICKTSYGLITPWGQMNKYRFRDLNDKHILQGGQ